MLTVLNRNDYWNGSSCVCNPSTPVWSNANNICEPCPGGTNWDGTKCVALTSEGNISANPNPCIIAIGESYCTSTVSWSSTNNTSPNVRVDYGPNISDGNPTASANIPWISYGGNIFQLRSMNRVTA